MLFEYQVSLSESVRQSHLLSLVGHLVLKLLRGLECFNISFRTSSVSDYHTRQSCLPRMVNPKMENVIDNSRVCFLRSRDNSSIIIIIISTMEELRAQVAALQAGGAAFCRAFGTETTAATAEAPANSWKWDLGLQISGVVTAWLSLGWHVVSALCKWRNGRRAGGVEGAGEPEVAAEPSLEDAEQGAAGGSGAGGRGRPKNEEGQQLVSCADSSSCQSPSVAIIGR